MHSQSQLRQLWGFISKQFYYLVHDIKPPIYFHQTTNFFLKEYLFTFFLFSSASKSRVNPCGSFGEAAYCPSSQLVPIFHLPLNGVPKLAPVFKLLKTAASFENGFSPFWLFQKKLRQVLKMVWASSDNFIKLRQVLKVVWANSDYFKKLGQVLKMVWASCLLSLLDPFIWLLGNL